MCRFTELMCKGKSLEASGLYRRAAEAYNYAFSISEAGDCQKGLSKQEKTSKEAASRCLSKSKIKINEGL
ncbi:MULTISPECIES: hypothetical protein [Providencia]|uniref:hypothetical protein n=1 Tax=Providencia TaxID=586 RepID=UPI0029D51B57|nr:hypothetical protein [Providencia rettgeri]MDX7322328.1 hypothetical protein [Providencia rettgeri]